MKKPGLLFLTAILLVLISCSKEDPNTPFNLLTNRTWVTDALLVNGQNAGGPGQLLENFKGEAKFNRDGTGTFGTYTGTWRFAQNETQIILTTAALPLPLTTIIEELSKTDLKVNTAVPNPLNPLETLQIRMTFKAK